MLRLRALESIETSSLPPEVKDNWTLRHHYDLAGLAIARKEYAAARAHAAKLRQGADHTRDPGELQQAHDARNLYWLGLAYGGKGDTTKAREFFTKAAGFNSLPSIYYSFIRTKAQKKVQDKKSS